MSTPLICSDPAVMMGKPVIAGTRITVELILEKLAADESVDQILAAHPRLTRAGVLAAAAYAAKVLHTDIILPVPSLLQGKQPYRESSVVGQTSRTRPKPMNIRVVKPASKPKYSVKVASRALEKAQ
ncbi:MAG: hypothetical protein RLZZ265_621 [Verrucomicrobiota bacterium]|jgi:uncharacterized protein (DUF433 family)